MKAKKAQNDDLPDLSDKGVQDAATKIQAAFKGHQVRKSKLDKSANEDLPDLKDAKVAEATMKIQTVYRGFHARKRVQEIKEDMKSKKINVESVAEALGTSGRTVKQKVSSKTPTTPASSIDLDNLPPPPKEPERKSSLVLEGTSNANFKKRQTEKPKAEFGVQKQHKSPLPERSTKLKEVPIPKVPTTEQKTPESATSDAAKESSSPSGDSAPQGDTQATGMYGIIRQASLGNFFKRKGQEG